VLKEGLKRIIPERIDRISKTELGEPYVFDGWRFDCSGEECLFYRYNCDCGIKVEHRRVVISELEELLEDCCDKLTINQDDFQRICPKTFASGPCGYEVSMKLLEILKLGHMNTEEGYFEVRRGY